MGARGGCGLDERGTGVEEEEEEEQGNGEECEMDTVALGFEDEEQAGEEEEGELAEQESAAIEKGWPNAGDIRACLPSP